MIKVYYDNGIYFKPDSSIGNDILIGKISGLEGVTYTNKGWRCEEKNIYEVRAALKGTKINPEPSFNKWVASNNLSDTLILYSGVIDTKIEGKNIPEEDIEKACRYFLKAAVNSKKYKQGHWDGYIRLYNKRTKKFPSGLIYLVTEILNRKGIKYTIIYDYQRRPNPQFNWEANDKIIPEPDQVEAIRLASKNLRGVIKAPTGFGKTAVLAVGLVSHFKVPSLFVANKKTLLDDARDAFLGLMDGVDQLDVEEIKDGLFGTVRLRPEMTSEEIPDLGAKIIVATIQSLNARLEDPRTERQMKKWLNENCKLVIVDETQNSGTKTWNFVLNECQAPLRFGLSATPKKTDGSTLTIHAQSGDVIFSTTADEQIEKGRLCELDIQYHPFDHKMYNEQDRDVVYAEAYAEWIVRNIDRNKFIVDETIKLVDEGRFTLVLINFIEHGEILLEDFISAGVARDDIRFVYGSTKDEARKAAIREFRKGEFKILIGSTIFDAGVNIPVISGIVIAGAGNSEITLIQKIGRAARTVDFEEEIGYLPDFMKDNPEDKISKIVDIMDLNVKFFTKQSWNRYNNAKEEFGAKRVEIIGGYSAIKKKTKTKASKVTEKLDSMEARLNMLEGFDGQDDREISTDFKNKAQQGLFDAFYKK